MAKRIIAFLVGVAVILPMIGGTCQPTYVPSRQARKPVQQKECTQIPVEEPTSLVRITSRPSHDTSPDISPDGEYIVFESWESGDFYARDYKFDVWVTGSNGGGGYRRITNSPSDDFYPRWYPDGSRIMFTSLRGGYPNIWAKSATGLGGTQRISWMGTYDFSGNISMKGDIIVFSRGENVIPTPFQISSHLFYPPRPWDILNEDLWLPRIYKMDINGARVTDLGPGFDPKLSPDGKKIVYTSFKSGTYDIWVMDIDGRNTTQITSGPGHEISPCWSPDGKWIAYSKSAPYAAPSSAGKSQKPEYWNIWIVNVETGENFQKTFNQNARDLAPAWGYVKEGSIYRDYIFFHSDRDDFMTTGFDIYRMDPNMGIEKYDLPDLKNLRLSEKKPEKEKKVVNKSQTFTESARIKVLNSTDIQGLAHGVAQNLKEHGLNVVEIGNTKKERNLPATKIYYRDGFRRLASRIAVDIMPGEQSIHYWEIQDADIIIALGGQSEQKAVSEEKPLEEKKSDAESVQ